MKQIVCAAVLAAILADLGVAQIAPGDYLVAELMYSIPAETRVHVITPAGVVKTFLKVPAWCITMTMAPDNAQVALIGLSIGFKHDIFLLTATGRVSTFAYVWTSGGALDGLTVDQGGAFVFPVDGANRTLWIARTDRQGRTTIIKPDPPVGLSYYRIAGIALDCLSGDYLAGDGFTLYRFKRDGRYTSVGALRTLGSHSDMLEDMRTESVVVTSKDSLWRVDLRTGAQTTIKKGFCYPGSRAGARGVAYDRHRDAWIVLEGSGCVWRVARQGAAVKLTTVTGSVADVEVYGSRNITASADPFPGLTMPLAFSEPGSAGLRYVAAAAFSSRPGIPTPVGVIDLAPDPLLLLSLETSNMFMNFKGTLDGNGRASAAVRIPPAPWLRGMRFYVSFVTTAGNRIRAIADTKGFTIG